MRYLVFQLLIVNKPLKVKGFSYKLALRGVWIKSKLIGLAKQNIKQAGLTIHLAPSLRLEVGDFLLAKLNSSQWISETDPSRLDFDKN